MCFRKQNPMQFQLEICRISCNLLWHKFQMSLILSSSSSFFSSRFPFTLSEVPPYTRSIDFFLSPFLLSFCSPLAHAVLPSTSSAFLHIYFLYRLFAKSYYSFAKLAFGKGVPLQLVFFKNLHVSVHFRAAFDILKPNFKNLKYSEHSPEASSPLSIVLYPSRALPHPFNFCFLRTFSRVPHPFVFYNFTLAQFSCSSHFRRVIAFKTTFSGIFRIFEWFRQG